MEKVVEEKEFRAKKNMVDGKTRLMSDIKTATESGKLTNCCCYFKIKMCNKFSNKGSD